MINFQGMITLFGYVLHPIEVVVAVLFILVLEYIFFAKSWIALTEMGIKNPWLLVITLSLVQLVAVFVWVAYP